ncbi:MAG: HPr family phosphocarrier protein [Gammaproteobacteria bacterium]|nr:HPr family phosphocarrier protein [Gammaproteobacteria bacterium]
MVVQRTLKIVNKLGLHARAAAKLVKLASTFEATIDIVKDEQRVDSKSIMGVMMLAASCGSSVTLYAEGIDAQAAVDAITDLIGRRFDEDE